MMARPALASMTGFARTAGASGAFSFAWELKTVNSKGLDLRLRLPAGVDSIETEARARIAHHLTRGNCNATLTLNREGTGASIAINQAALAGLIAALKAVPGIEDLAPPSIDGLLAVRGIVEVVEGGVVPVPGEAEAGAMLAALDECLAGLVAMRQTEGASMAAVLRQRLDAIARLTQAADAAPARKPDAIRAKLAEQIRFILDNTGGFDEARLHQEAVLMATRADIREELDRLMSHVEAARTLVEGGGPVGRRLDFLAQEFGREANTLCSKANDVSLTAIGLDLKAEIEQFREQVQNIE